MYTPLIKIEILFPILCKELAEKGIDVIILDHHICDKQNDFAIVVNNQMQSVL